MSSERAPAREMAPTLVAVSDDEIVLTFYNSDGHDPILASDVDDDMRKRARAVRAELGAAEVTEERLAAAIHEAYGGTEQLGGADPDGGAPAAEACLLP